MTLQNISNIFENKPRTLSFEFFPPKTEVGRERLFQAAAELAELEPDFFSVTYGAGGSTSNSTLQIVETLQEKHNIPVMHHLTCTKHTRNDIREQLNEMMVSGVHNILALRGDAPADELHWQPGPDEPRYAFELIKLIRERAGWFTVGGALFPEGHPETDGLDLDSMYTRIKQDIGAEFGITQVFFENDVYRDFIQRTDTAGVSIRCIPGILPIVNYDRLVRFCETCKATLSPRIRNIFEPLAGDATATLEKGIDIVSEQCKELLEMGAPGLHFYCLNNAEPARSILSHLDTFWKE